MNSKRKRLFDIIQIGNKSDVASKSFDFFIVGVILVNLFITMFDTFEESADYKAILNVVELITIIIFTIEYILRLWTADYLYSGDKNKSRLKCTVKFIFSAYGIIDLLTFLPYYLPVFFPAGAVAFRMLRVVRILRLFRINSQYDAFNVITNVLSEKKNQILSSVFMVVILMIASSLCMYSVEHDAQPGNFKNAFSGIWWSASTLLTVGYGDIYPITNLGKFCGMIISFLGVGMVAIPTGIISAGFVEHYSKIRNLDMFAQENDINFVSILVKNNHNLRDIYVKDANLPQGLVLALILRDEKVIIPQDNTKIQLGDRLILGGEHYVDEIGIKLKEVIIKSENPWIDMKIKDLDMSRLSTIVMIKRRNKVLIPTPETVINKSDVLLVYSKKVEDDV